MTGYRQAIMRTARISLLLLAGMAAQAAELSAGAGKAAIAIPASVFPVDGFTGVHDALQARVLLLASGPKRIAITVVDQTSISGESVRQIQDIVSQATGAASEDILVCASHTFSAPHVLPPEHQAAADAAPGAALQRAIAEAVRRAATEARQGLRPARMGFGLGSSSVNVNRDVRTAAGWWLGANDSGVSDKSLGIVRFDDLDGHPFALLMNYAVQSSVMDAARMSDGGLRVSADLAGAATREVEQRFGGGLVSLFLVGAAGDQAPYLSANRHALDGKGNDSRIDLHEAGYPLLELQGERLGGAAVDTGKQIRADQAAPTLRLVRASVTVAAQASSPPAHPVLHYRFTPDGTADVPVWLLQIGDTVLVGVQAELSSQTGLDLKRRSPYPHTLILTMVNGAAKYLPDAASFDRISYEAMSSRYAAGAAEIVSARIIGLLDALHTDAAR